MTDRKDPNQGEGDRISGRRYDRHVEEFVAEGKVPPAARNAKEYVEKDPEGAARAERAARRGPHGYLGMIEAVVAKGRSMFERMRARITAASQKR
jgi:hypothetical protein